MPSDPHQWLLVWIARKMAHDGFWVGGYEGPTPQGGVWNALPPPFDMKGVRPDAWGVSLATGEIALGEAKTPDDIDQLHTREQLRVFGSLRNRLTGNRCRVYVAVPRSTAYVLDRVLIATRLMNAKHVVRLHVPDCLLAEAPR